jgi:aryl-alcohol dehydrogenase-like predicted oxidoreductase
VAGGAPAVDADGRARRSPAASLMPYKPLGRTNLSVSAVGFGAWAIGGAWGAVDDDASMAALHAAVDAGVNFIDTADVYGDGRSERLVARLRRERPGDQIWVATKAGRRLPAQTPDGYTREHLTAWVDRSLTNLETDAIDLLQLHCPHRDVYDRPEVFGFLDDLVAAGKLRHYGVSVETVDEAMKAIRYPNVATVQIIFNMFRLKPAERFFSEALAAKVGVIARVPLASGLLTGKFHATSTFADDDHRSFNRNGARFDKGETFSGVPYDTALGAVEAIRALAPSGVPLSQFALRWILMFEAVSCAIPGARTADQARANAAAAARPPLSPAIMAAVARVYDERIRPEVHGQW